MVQVFVDSHATAAQQHQEHITQHQPPDWQPVTEPLNIQDLPAFKTTMVEYRRSRSAVQAHLWERRDLTAARQTEIAGRYNAAYEEMRKGVVKRCDTSCMHVHSTLLYVAVGHACVC